MSTSIDSSRKALNISELLSRVDDDQELLCELLQLFKEECPPLVHTLEEAMSRDDLEGVERAGHALKGMLANLSAKGAATAAGRLEQLGKTQDKFGLKSAFASLESELALLMPELDAYLSAQ